MKIPDGVIGKVPYGYSKYNRTTENDMKCLDTLTVFQYKQETAMVLLGKKGFTVVKYFSGEGG